MAPLYDFGALFTVDFMFTHARARLKFKLNLRKNFPPRTFAKLLSVSEID